MIDTQLLAAVLSTFDSKDESGINNKCCGVIASSL